MPPSRPATVPRRRKPSCSGSAAGGGGAGALTIGGGRGLHRRPARGHKQRPLARRRQCVERNGPERIAGPLRGAAGDGRVGRGRVRAKRDGAGRADQRQPDRQAISRAVHTSCFLLLTRVVRRDADRASANYAIGVGISTVFRAIGGGSTTCTMEPFAARVRYRTPDVSPQNLRLNVVSNQTRQFARPGTRHVRFMGDRHQSAQAARLPGLRHDDGGHSASLRTRTANCARCCAATNAAAARRSRRRSLDAIPARRICPDRVTASRC